MRQNPNTHASGVEITQTLRRNRAKIFAKFPEFRRTARTKFACTRPTYVAQPAEQRESFSPSLQCVQMQKSLSDAPRSRRSCAKIARNNCKISRNFNAPRAEKLLEIGQHALRKPKNVAEALHRVGSASKSEEVRVWRRCHANFAPNLREEIAKFSEFWRAARTKTACIRPATAAHAAKRRLKLSEPTMRSIPKKRAFGVEITQMLRQNRAKELQNF